MTSLPLWRAAIPLLGSLFLCGLAIVAVGTLLHPQPLGAGAGPVLLCSALLAVLTTSAVLDPRG